MMWLNNKGRPRHGAFLKDSDRRRGLVRHPGAPRACSRAAFTLVELLVALVLISILSGMVVVAINATQQHARQMATQGLVQRIDQVLQAKWDEYRYRPLNVEIDNSTNPFDPASGHSPPQILPEEAARVRLIMLRDLMRMEMPDRMTDLLLPNGSVASPVTIRASAIAYERDTATGALLPLQPVPRPVLWSTPSLFLTYHAKISPTWTAEHQSSECLYLIMSTSTVNGVSAIDLLSPVDIEDTDGDGMPEIVDAWGNPISWIRWPAGSETLIATAGEDEFDILASDWGAVRGNVEKPYNLTPMVISPGSDGVLGYYTTQNPTTPYSLMQWPTNQTDGSGRPTPYFYIDPYDRVATGGINTNGTTPPTPDRSTRPGAPIPEARDAIADDIVSFNL